MIIKQLHDIEEKEIVPGYYAKFVHSENVTIAYWNIKANHTMPEHAHPHEQVVNLLEGTFELVIDGKPQRAKPGTVIIIPPDMKHSGNAITDCRILDVFYPIREDYRK
jgi:quercetin dioxygenase-like cupin family protein